jgi:hypothetical protein
LSKSVCVFVQVPALQRVWPVPHPTEHLLLEHTRPPPQVAPQEPQLSGSFVVLTHVPEQEVFGVWQVFDVVSTNVPSPTVEESTPPSDGPLLALLEHPETLTVAHMASATSRCTTRVRRLGSLKVDMAKTPVLARRDVRTRGNHPLAHTICMTLARQAGS